MSNTYFVVIVSLVDVKHSTTMFKQTLAIALLAVGASAFAPSATFVHRGAPLFGIEERVSDIIVEQLGVKKEDVINSAMLVDDLGADSLDAVELVMALEEEFDMEIPDDEAEKITSVQAAIDYVTKSQ